MGQVPIQSSIVNADWKVSKCVEKGKWWGLVEHCPISADSVEECWEKYQDKKVGALPL